MRLFRTLVFGLAAGAGMFFASRVAGGGQLRWPSIFNATPQPRDESAPAEGDLGPSGVQQ